MPRYFFNVFDGTSELDHDGTELPDIAAARQIALRYAGEILSDQSHSLALGESWHLEVADEARRVFFRLDFHTTDVSIAPEPDPSKRTAGADHAQPSAIAGPTSRHVRD